MTDSLSSDQITTPRTDAVALSLFQWRQYTEGSKELVPADFARAQELRIAEMESHNATLEKSNKRLREKYDGLLSERDMP